MAKKRKNEYELITSKVIIKNKKFFISLYFKTDFGTWSIYAKDGPNVGFLLANCCRNMDNWYKQFSKEHEVGLDSLIAYT